MKKILTQKFCKLGLASAVMVCSVGAMAAEFTGSVQVQNTIAVQNTGDVSFGTISIAAAAGDGTPANAEYAAIEVAPTGDVTVGSSDSATIDIVNLGGATPATASVATGSNFTLQFPAGSWVAESADLTDLATAKDTAIPLIASGIKLQNSENNPGIPDFYLINLTVGEVTQPEGFGEPTAVQGSETNTWDFTAGIDTNQYDFAIGGTLATDPTQAGAYQELLYSGTFEVTANF